MFSWTDEIVEHEGLYKFIFVPRVNPSLQGISASPEQIDLVSRMSYLMEPQKTLDVSSSLVRERLKSGASHGLPVPVGVLDQIRHLGLYDVNSREPKTATEE